jgi:hypothetical protein
VWWYLPIIPALRTQGRKMANYRQHGKHSKILSQKINKNKEVCKIRAHILLSSKK